MGETSAQVAELASEVSKQATAVQLGELCQKLIATTNQVKAMCDELGKVELATLQSWVSAWRAMEPAALEALNETFYKNVLLEMHETVIDHVLHLLMDDKDVSVTMEELDYASVLEDVAKELLQAARIRLKNP